MDEVAIASLLYRYARAVELVRVASVNTERYGRVRRLARGLYGPGYVPRATEYRMHQRVLALRAAAKPLWLGGTQL